jgi:hypothetical protein
VRELSVAARAKQLGVARRGKYVWHSEYVKYVWANACSLPQCMSSMRASSLAHMYDACSMSSLRARCHN